MAKLHDKRLGEPPTTDPKSIPYELARVEADSYRRLLKLLDRIDQLTAEMRKNPGNEELSLALSSVLTDSERAWEEYQPVYKAIWNKFWFHSRCRECLMFFRYGSKSCEHCDDGRAEIPEIVGGLKGITAIGTAKVRLKRERTNDS